MGWLNNWTFFSRKRLGSRHGPSCSDLAVLRFVHHLGHQIVAGSGQQGCQFRRYCQQHVPWHSLSSKGVCQVWWKKQKFAIDLDGRHTMMYTWPYFLHAILGKSKKSFFLPSPGHGGFRYIYYDISSASANTVGFYVNGAEAGTPKFEMPIKKI